MISKQNLTGIGSGNLRRVHHIAFNVQDLQVSRHFYGNILGLDELTGEQVPSTLRELVTAGKLILLHQMVLSK